MKDFKFKIEVTEIHKKVYEVSAASAIEAISFIHDKFSERKPDTEYVLDQNDFVDREIGLHHDDFSRNPKKLSYKESIYHQVLRELHIKECAKHLKSALNSSYLAKMVEEEDLNAMAERFEDEHNCNISDNENWTNTIQSVFEETFFTPNEFNGKPKAALISNKENKGKKSNEAYFKQLKKNNVYVLRLTDNLFIYDDSKEEDVLICSNEFGIVLYNILFGFKNLHLTELSERALHLIESHYHLKETATK